MGNPTPEFTGEHQVRSEAGIEAESYSRPAANPPFSSATSVISEWEVPGGSMASQTSQGFHFAEAVLPPQAPVQPLVEAALLPPAPVQPLAQPLPQPWLDEQAGRPGSQSLPAKASWQQSSSNLGPQPSQLQQLPLPRQSPDQRGQLQLASSSNLGPQPSAAQPLPLPRPWLDQQGQPVPSRPGLPGAKSQPAADQPQRPEAMAGRKATSVGQFKAPPLGFLLQRSASGPMPSEAAEPLSTKAPPPQPLSASVSKSAPAPPLSALTRPEALSTKAPAPTPMVPEAHFAKRPPPPLPASVPASVPANQAKAASPSQQPPPALYPAKPPAIPAGAPFAAAQQQQSQTGSADYRIQANAILDRLVQEFQELPLAGRAAFLRRQDMCLPAWLHKVWVQRRGAFEQLLPPPAQEEGPTSQQQQQQQPQVQQQGQGQQRSVGEWSSNLVDLQPPVDSPQPPYLQQQQQQAHSGVQQWQPSQPASSAASTPQHGARRDYYIGTFPAGEPVSYAPGMASAASSSGQQGPAVPAFQVLGGGQNRLWR